MHESVRAKRLWGREPDNVVMMRLGQGAATLRHLALFGAATASCVMTRPARGLIHFGSLVKAGFVVQRRLRVLLE